MLVFVFFPELLKYSFFQLQFFLLSASKMMSCVCTHYCHHSNSLESCDCCRESISETAARAPLSTSICIPVIHIIFKKDFTTRLLSVFRKCVHQMSRCTLVWKWLRCGGRWLYFFQRGVAWAFPMQKKKHLQNMNWCFICTHTCLYID